MKNISKIEAITFFEEYSKAKLSSFKFSVDAGNYIFNTPPLTRNSMGLLYILALFLPHIVHFNFLFNFGAHTNNAAYIIFTVFGMIFSFLLAFYLPIQQVVTNCSLNEIIITPNDYIGQFLKNKTIIKIENIVEINYKHIKRYKGKNINYVYILTNEDISVNLFQLDDWDNVSKIKAAFSTLVYNKTTTYDDSDESA